MSMPKVVQFEDGQSLCSSPEEQEAPPAKPISRARDTESEGNTHIDNMMYDMPMAMAVTRPRQ